MLFDSYNLPPKEVEHFFIAGERKAHFHISIKSSKINK